MKVVITRGENDWKHEVVVYKNKTRVIRLKVYCKTADKLTSCGVANQNTYDPLSKLLLTNDYNGYKQPQYKYDRKLFSFKG